MHRLSIAQALSIWSDLEQAYHGTHGYGGDVAEIYLSRLMPRSPMAEPVLLSGRWKDFAPGLMADLAREVMEDSNESLHRLLCHFQSERDCLVLIEVTTTAATATALSNLQALSDVVGQRVGRPFSDEWADRFKPVLDWDYKADPLLHRVQVKVEVERNMLVTQALNQGFLGKKL